MATAFDFKAHLLDDVLPWWLSHGPDVRRGGVFTCWSNDSQTLVSTDKYTWSQGRWVYLMAHLAQAAQDGRLPIDADHLLDLAHSSASFIWDHQILPDGRTAWVTTEDGTVIDPGDGAHQSVFSDMFVALGWGALGQVSGDTTWGQRALDMLVQARQAILSGDYRCQPYPVPTGYRSLGLPMITVNTAEQVYRATKEQAALDLLHQAMDELVEYHLVGADMAEMPGGPTDELLAHHRTPGHILELMWFLWHARDLAPDHQLAQADTLAAIARHALAIGWDDTFGGLLRYTDLTGGKPGGKPGGFPIESLVLETWDTKLWWVHAEALYTTALMDHITGDHDFGSWHTRIADYVTRHFMEGPGMEWTQNLDRDGSPHEGVVALPVKDPFHVARALLNLVNLTESEEFK